MSTFNITQVVKTITPRTKINARDFKSVGKYPIISQEASLISGFWDKDDDVMHFDNPVVVYGDHTRIIKFINFSFVAGADGIKILSPRENLDAKYLYYWLQANPVDNLGYARHFRLLKEKNIYIPSLDVQRRIVAKLDAAFSKIDRASELARHNLVNSSILFAKLINNQILANQRYAEIPLGDVCGFVRGPFGGSLKKEIFKESGYAVYEQRHAIYNNFSNVRYFIDERKFDEMKRFELLPNDLIMSCSGTMGKIAIAPGNLKKGIINQALLKFSPQNSKLDTCYLKYWIESSIFQAMLGINSGGAAIKNVASVKILKELPIALPPLSEQIRTVDIIATLKKQEQALTESMKSKLSYLRELKQSMLKQTFLESDVK